MIIFHLFQLIITESIVFYFVVFVGPHNTKVNFSGNFLTSKVSDITVTVDDVECKINKLENNQLEVEMPSYKAGKVVPKVHNLLINNFLRIFHILEIIFYLCPE